MRTLFKDQLTQWYNNFKMNFENGVQFEPRVVCEEDVCYNLTNLTPFMYTVFEMLSEKILDYQSYMMSHKQFIHYLIRTFKSDIQDRLHDPDNIVIVTFSPDIEYVVTRDEKGYLFFNSTHGPNRMSLTTFSDNGINSYDYLYVPKNYPYIQVKMITAKMNPDAL